VYLAPSSKKGELEEVVVTAGGAQQMTTISWQPPPQPLLHSLDGHHITEPPPAYSEGQKKIIPLPDNGSDGRQRASGGGGGLLSALLDKVRPREECGGGSGGGGRRSQTTECLAFGLKDDSRWQLDNLDCTGTLLRGLSGGGGVGRGDDVKKSPGGGPIEYTPAVAATIQKPYEPPVLGKSSRITPVCEIISTVATLKNIKYLFKGHT
jgi:hypothetical protein